MPNDIRRLPLLYVLATFLVVLVLLYWTRVTGYCAVAGCGNIADAMPAASERLSDHCPVVIEIQDRDLD